MAGNLQKAICEMKGMARPFPLVWWPAANTSITPTASPKSVFQALNPDLPDLPQYTVDHPVSTAVSPDGATLLILTSGYSLNHDAKNKPIPGQSNEYVFVYDITQGTPVKKQVLQVPNTFVGLAWNPNGEEFYVSGGADDDVHIFEKKSGPVGGSRATRGVGA